MSVSPPIPSEVKAEPCVHNTSHWLHIRDKVQKRVWKLQSADRCLCGSPASSSRSSHLGRLYLIICMRWLSFCLNADRWKRDECEWARISCHSANLIFCQHFARLVSELLFGECEKTRLEGKGDSTISRHRGPKFKPQTPRWVQRMNGMPWPRRGEGVWKSSREGVHSYVEEKPWILLRARVINLFIYPVRQVDEESGWVSAWLITLSCPS